MAAINLSSMQVLSFLRLFSSFPQNTPSLSFNSHPKPSLNLRPIYLKPYNSEKPRARLVVLAAKSLGDTELVVVSPENDGLVGELPSGAGVYAVYDKDNELQFIGLSRNIAASVSAHRKSVPVLCGSVKILASLVLTKIVQVEVKLREGKEVGLNREAKAGFLLGTRKF